MDKINDEITTTDHISTLTTNVEINSFPSVLQIKQDGSCPICVAGTSINTISIAEDIGNVLQIHHYINDDHATKCYSCDANKNQFIKCKDEHITIEQNYWMGIIDNENIIISSICPSNQCCQNENGCDYIYDKLSFCGL